MCTSDHKRIASTLMSIDQVITLSWCCLPANFSFNCVHSQLQLHCEHALLQSQAQSHLSHVWSICSLLLVVHFVQLYLLPHLTDPNSKSFLKIKSHMSRKSYITYMSYVKSHHTSHMSKVIHDVRCHHTSHMSKVIHDVRCHPSSQMSKVSIGSL